jgi:hypothetical protein
VIFLVVLLHDFVCLVAFHGFYFSPPYFLPYLLGGKYATKGHARVAISGIKVRSGGRESSFPRHLT